jgi:CHASE2 domain-containing sensor protein
MNGSQAAQPGRRETAVNTLRHLGTRLLLALTAGSALYIAAYLLSSLPFMRLVAEQAGDARMQLFADFPAPAGKAPEMLFLDLDQESYAQLDRPAVTPRELLAAMLEKVAEGKPRLIILDFDPTWPGAGKEGTQTLADTLARLGRGTVPILLHRTPMAPAVQGGAIYFRPSPKLDPVVAGSNSLMWVSSGAVASADGVVRRAPLWIRGCLGEKHVRLPNPALAGWMILAGEPPGTFKKRLSEALEEPNGVCIDGKAPAAQRTDTVPLTIAKEHYDVGTEWPTGTITYSMSGELAKGQRRDLNTLMVLSARPFIKASHGISAEVFRDRAVIIGASAHDLRDIHLTPLGQMPGAMVIANQLRSLQEFGLDKNRQLWIGLLTTMFLCVGTFLAWLGFRYIVPNAPYIVEQIYSLLICGVIWAILIVLANASLFILIPLLQYIVLLVLFAIDHGNIPRFPNMNTDSAR